MVYDSEVRLLSPMPWAGKSESVPGPSAYSYRNLEYLPPGGHHNGNLSSAAGKYGFWLVFWTANCSECEGKTPDHIVKPVISDATSGGVILMYNVEDVTLLALLKVIDQLKAAGDRLVAMDELLKPMQDAR